MARASGKDGRISVSTNGTTFINVNGNRVEPTFTSDTHDVTGFEDVGVDGQVWQVMVPGIQRGTVNMSVIADSTDAIHGASTKLKQGETIDCKVYIDKDGTPYTGKILINSVGVPVATTEGVIFNIQGVTTGPWVMPNNPLAAPTP
jgi:hypothetical protein